MAMTYKPEDKFAFLYSGKADIVHQTNLKEVYELLTGYLNYPAANVKVCLGGTIDSSILDTSVVSTVTTIIEAKEKFYEFAALVAARNPGAVKINTVLYYFTGEVTIPANPMGSFDDQYPGFVYKDDGSAIYITNLLDMLTGINPSPDAMDPRLSVDFISNSYIHYLVDTDKAQLLDSILDMVGIDPGSKTFSCASNQVSAADNLSEVSAYTYHWCRAFKMISFTKYGIDYADKIAVGTAGDSPSDELVSLEKANGYAIYGLDTLSQTATYLPFGSPGPHYLGKPYLVIRDGNPNLWQSPDIRLYHPDPNPPHNILPDTAGDYIDDYAVDAALGSTDFYYKNHIYIDVWNYGTHPVVHFKANVLLYDTGCGGTGTQGTLKDVDLRANPLMKYAMVPVNAASIPPVSEADIEDDKFSFCTGVELIFNDILFQFDTHRCIRAKTVLGTEADPDMVNWDFVKYDHEAQRNINNGAISSSTGGGGGSGSGKKEVIDLKGIFRKKFLVENPFKKKKLFRIVNPYLPELEDIFEISVSRLGERVRKISPLLLGPRKYFDFWLNPGEKAEFLAEIRNKINIKAFEQIEFNFEIMVSEKSSDPFLLNRSILKMPGFITIAGFTIKLDVIDANLNLLIKDEKGNPAPLTKVVIESADGLLRAEFKTDKNGILRLEGITPANYKIAVIGKTGKSPAHVFADLRKLPDRMMRMEVKKKLLG